MIGPFATVLVPLVAVPAFFILVMAVAKRYRKVGPNQVMVISGRRHKAQTARGEQDVTGYRIRKGGGAFIFPLLERVDMPTQPPPPFTVEDLRAMLDGAAREIEHSIDFWNRYQVNLRSKYGVNAFSEAAPVPRGVQDVLYSHAFVALDDDQAVLLSHEIARAIESELEYPGQIKVTVIRESRAVEYAR